MVKPADIGGKRLIGLAPDAWVKWVTQSADVLAGEVRQIMRWDMAVLHESPWYQEILQQGEIRGEIRGLLSGIELGLELKFGSQGLHLMPEISQITDVNALTAIQQGLWTMNTLEEIRHIYRVNEE